MGRILTILILTIFLTGCATDGAFRTSTILDGPCGDRVAGYTLTGIAYGDSHLVVVPVSDIKAGAEWRFYLRPSKRANDIVDYETVKVTITGKFPAVNDPPDRNDWISVSGAYADDSKHYLVQCVPDDLDEGEQYEFLVEVKTVGTLDPRADVK